MPSVDLPSPRGRHGIVLVLNVDGRGQWYCHPFRGFCGHVAHPLACFRGSGRMQAEVAGGVTDVLPGAKPNTERRGRVRVGQADRWNGYGKISVPLPSILKLEEGAGLPERCRDIGSHSATSCLCGFNLNVPNEWPQEEVGFEIMQGDTRNVKVGFNPLVKHRASVWTAATSSHSHFWDSFEVQLQVEAAATEGSKTGRVSLVSCPLMAHPITGTWLLHKTCAQETWRYCHYTTETGYALFTNLGSLPLIPLHAIMRVTKEGHRECVSFNRCRTEHWFPKCTDGFSKRTAATRVR